MFDFILLKDKDIKTFNTNVFKLQTTWHWLQFNENCKTLEKKFNMKVIKLIEKLITQYHIVVLHLIIFTHLMMNSAYKIYACISLNCK